MVTTTDLICHEAAGAAIRHEARRAGVPVPLVCSGGQPSTRFIHQGSGLTCLSCDYHPQPTDQVHPALIATLQEGIQAAE